MRLKTVMIAALAALGLLVALAGCKDGQGKGGSGAGAARKPATPLEKFAERITKLEGAPLEADGPRASEAPAATGSASLERSAAAPPRRSAPSRIHAAVSRRRVIRGPPPFARDMIAKTAGPRLRRLPRAWYIPRP